MEVVRLLLENGANTDSDGERALMAAFVGKGHNAWEVMQLLLNNGVNARTFMEHHGDFIRKANGGRLTQLLIDRASY
jgi:hypothetical protein